MHDKVSAFGRAVLLDAFSIGWNSKMLDCAFGVSGSRVLSKSCQIITKIHPKRSMKPIWAVVSYSENFLLGEAQLAKL